EDKISLATVLVPSETKRSRRYNVTYLNVPMAEHEKHLAWFYESHFLNDSLQRNNENKTFKDRVMIDFHEMAGYIHLAKHYYNQGIKTPWENSLFNIISK